MTKASRDWCRNFTKAHGAEIMRLALVEFALVLESAEARIVVARGAKRYRLGPYVLLNLAEAYYRLGRQPAKSDTGPFGRFVKDVIDGMGWETDWIKGQITQIGR